MELVCRLRRDPHGGGDGRSQAQYVRQRRVRRGESERRSSGGDRVEVRISAVGANEEGAPTEVRLSVRGVLDACRWASEDPGPEDAAA